MNINNKRKTVSFLSRNVIVLSIVSFFTDIATEMLYPIMPLYLSDIGYGIILIGLIEGITQLVAGVIKLASGVYSDHLQQRKGLVNIGYSISALAKPMMGLFPTYWAIFGFRLLDRFGKGVRNAPRDALLADVSTPVNRGRVFGFHRAADTLGATLGPLITLAIMYFYSENIPLIIGLTVIPGICAVVAGWFIKESKKKTDLPAAEKGGIKGLYRRLTTHYRAASPNYKRILYLITLITLIKSTDIYLLLRARELGLSDLLIISAYVAYNLTGTLIIYYLGSLSDRIGFAKTFAIGALSLGATYMLLSQNELPLLLVFASFIIYAVFQSIYEGLTSAWMSLHIKQEERASGLGVMMAFQAVATLIGTLVIGLTWTGFGAKIVFAITGLQAVGLAAYLFFTQQRDYNSKTDFGRKPYVEDIKRLTIENENFRTAIWTGRQLQVTVMSIQVGGEVGLEVHKNIDQFLRIEDGEGLVQMGPREDDLSFEQQAHTDSAIMVPAGMFHNIINTGSKPLKIYSIYAPSEHPYGTVHKTADDADREELAELLEDD
ncbi:MFS transporter [Paenibacillus prosopidis]|uniref:Mannose-6-phosphate isomerase-like protein (Cupin superfamily) n=1 Tax=Paenibacillus prosopidis TaxID=630520 RepID=A0A368VPU4_9BACL|nr:MFS transporter [Paenibacillus prosopidis]RCW43035.1 mannose-6-phosphate isomerase-like protein (cupin superfamily) [Paenibacillus prosopidis]